MRSRGDSRAGAGAASRSTPSQEGSVNGAFYRQLAEVSFLLALILMERFSHLGICWKGNTALSRQSRSFLCCIQHVNAGGARPGLHSSCQWWLGSQYQPGLISCHHDWIQDLEGGWEGKLQSYDSGFRKKIQKIAWDATMKWKYVQEIWMIFKEHTREKLKGWDPFPERTGHRDSETAVYCLWQLQWLGKSPVTRKSVTLHLSSEGENGNWGPLCWLAPSQSLEDQGVCPLSRPQMTRKYLGIVSIDLLMSNWAWPTSLLSEMKSANGWRWKQWV